jgi:hypothetical protein
MPALAVVAKGKAAGLTFSDKYVYTIRAKRPKLGRPKGAKNKPGPKSTGSNAEAQFIDAALNLGLTKAEAILARVRSAIRSAAIG